MKILPMFAPKGPINNFCSIGSDNDLVPATSHYLHQWWLDYRRIYASRNLNELSSKLDEDCFSGMLPVLRQAIAWTSVNHGTLRNKLQWDSNHDTKLLSHENAFENFVCKMAAIWSRGSWVKRYT